MQQQRHVESEQVLNTYSPTNSNKNSNSVQHGQEQRNTPPGSTQKRASPSLTNTDRRSNTTAVQSLQTEPSIICKAFVGCY